MKTKQYILILVMIALASGFTADQFAQGQEIGIMPGVNLDADQVIVVIVIGAVAGAVRAWQGYDKSPKDFDKIRFVNGVRDAVLISVPFALSSAVMMTLNAYGYAMLFFAVIGATSLWAKHQQATVPEVS